MKHAVLGLTLALLAATSTVARAEDAEAGAAGTIEKASGFAVGDISTVIAVGLGATTAIAVLVVGAEGGGTSTATSTAQ